MIGSAGFTNSALVNCESTPRVNGSFPRGIFGFCRLQVASFSLQVVSAGDPVQGPGP